MKNVLIYTIRLAVKELFAVLLRASGMPLIVLKLNAKRTGILVYHRPLPSRLEEHIKYLSRHYSFISMEKLTRAVISRRWAAIPEKSLVLTLDDGYAENAVLLDIFKKYGIKPTIYLVSGIAGTAERYRWLNGKSGARQALSREEIRSMAGHVDFGSHTRTHPFLTSCDDKISEDEITASKKEVEALSGEECAHFAYPAGEYSARETTFAKKAGYLSARTCDHGWNDGNVDLFRLKAVEVADDASVNWLIAQMSGVPAFLKAWFSSMRGNIAERTKTKKGTPLPEKLRKVIAKLKNMLGTHEKIIVKGTGVAFIGIAVFDMVCFIALTVKTHLMSAGDLGLLVLARSITLTSFILATGFSGSVLRFVSLYRGEGNKEKIKGVVTVAYKYAVPVYFLIFVLVNIFASDIALRMFKQERLVLPIRILSCMALVQGVTDINIALLISKYKVHYKYIFDIAIQLLTLFFVFLLFVFGQRDFLLMFAAGWTFAALVVMFRSLYDMKREFSFVFDRSVRAIETRKDIFVYTIITQLTSMLDRFRVEINIFIIAFFLVASDVALYNVAFQLGLSAGVILESMNAIFPSVVGNLYGKKMVDEIKKLHFRSALILGALAVFIFTFFVLFGKPVLWIFGDFYRNAYFPLLIIAFSFIVESAVGSAGRILNMMGKPHYNTLNTFIALLLAVALSYLLIPLWGVIGAAAAFAVSNIVRRFLMLGQVLWVYRLERLALI